MQPKEVLGGQSAFTITTDVHLQPCTLHIAHCTLHIAHCTLHIAHNIYIVHTIKCNKLKVDRNGSCTFLRGLTYKYFDAYKAASAYDAHNAYISYMKSMHTWGDTYDAVLPYRLYTLLTHTCDVCECLRLCCIKCIIIFVYILHAWHTKCIHLNVVINMQDRRMHTLAARDGHRNPCIISPTQQLLLDTQCYPPNSRS